MFFIIKMFLHLNIIIVIKFIQNVLIDFIARVKHRMNVFMQLRKTGIEPIFV